MELRLGTYSISIDCDNDWVLRELEADFAAFPAVQSLFLPLTRQRRHLLSLKLGGSPDKSPSSSPLWFPLFRFRGAAVSARAGEGRVLYVEGGEVLRSRGSEGQTSISAPSRERLHEISYLFLLSRLGEWLDLDGFHRVHGLSVSFIEGGTALFVMDSGVGKSTLALTLRARLAPNSVRFHSDEIPLLKAGVVYPMPLRVAASRSSISLSGYRLHNEESRGFGRSGRPVKVLLPFLETLGDPAPPALLSHVVHCRRSVATSAGFGRSSRARSAFELLRASVIGIGVPQMAEHLLRPEASQVARLGAIACSRLWASMHTLRKARHWTMDLGDPDENAHLARAHFAQG